MQRMLDTVQCTTGRLEAIVSYIPGKAGNVDSSSCEPSRPKPGGLAPYAAALQKLLQGLEGGVVPLTSFCPNPRLLHLWVQHFLPSLGTEEKGFGGLCLKLHPAIIHIRDLRT